MNFTSVCTAKPPAPPILNWVTKNGITGPEYKVFFEREFGLTPFQIRELRKESIEFPMDFAEFGEDDIDSIVSNMKKLKPPVTLHGIATTKLKYTCSWASRERTITYVMTVIPIQVHFLYPNRREEE